MIHIVFENDNFVFCDKESGVLSTPSRFEEQDSRECLGTRLQKMMGFQIYPVHRLDFEVSGLVMYAKNPQAHRQANAWFENKKVKKTYRALTVTQDFEHIPDDVKNEKIFFALHEGKKFEWKCLLLRGKRRAYESPGGKQAVTLATYLGENKSQFLMWDLNPVTGRSHQLRFELSRHGFPIVGDALYGSKISWHPNAIALRSYKINFSESPGASELGLPDEISLSPDDFAKRHI